MGTMIPADAMGAIEQAAKNRDYYAELTDEEREEEGLPPREGAKAADPDPDPTPAPADEPEEEEEGDDEEIEAGEDVGQRLLDQIADLRKELLEAKGDEPPKGPKGEERFLDEALEHEDPAVRAIAAELRETKERLAALDAAEEERRIAAQEVQDAAEFQDVRDGYTIAGKPLTDRHIEKIENYILRNPEAGRLLTIEEVARRVLPTAVKAGPKPSPAKGPGGSSKGQPVATIVDEGSGAGGAPAGPWKPRPNETVESAISEAGRRLFGVNRG